MNIVQTMIWNCGHASSSSATLPSSTHSPYRTNIKPEKKKGRNREGNGISHKKSRTQGESSTRTYCRPLVRVLPSSTLEGRKVVKLRSGDLLLHQAECVISPPTQIELFKSRLEVSGIHHVGDSCIKSRLQGNPRLQFLGWRHWNFFLFPHHLFLCHRR